MLDLIIIGGGAAGIFAAIVAKEHHPTLRVCVLEKSAQLLSKVRISGGGRCNVTHACFDPHQLVHFYPRGSRELLGPFYRFNPSHTLSWFHHHGVVLKTEADGRMFPVTDSSATIIECLLKRAKELDIEIRTKQKIDKLSKHENHFYLFFKDGTSLVSPRLLLATGSSVEGYQWAEQLGHTIEEPVPSLFTFNIPHSELAPLSGISIDPVVVHLPQAKLTQHGPLLITHFGFSGPAVLKLSAWGARFLYDCNYQTEVRINWLPNISEINILQLLKEGKQKMPHKPAAVYNPFSIPKNLWRHFLGEAGNKNLITCADRYFQSIALRLHSDRYLIDGKTTHKEEFVTCGGVKLREVDFKSMQSKICPGLFFAGEILDIDGVTGGFNFQNAWTTAFIAGSF